MNDWCGIANRQAMWVSVQSTAASSSLQVEACLHEGIQLLFDISTGQVLPLIPVKDRHALFMTIHGVAHPGMRVTRRLVSAHVIWCGMASDLAKWCRLCQLCQRAKGTKQPAAAIQPIPIPLARGLSGSSPRFS